MASEVDKAEAAGEKRVHGGGSRADGTIGVEVCKGVPGA